METRQGVVLVVTVVVLFAGCTREAPTRLASPVAPTPTAPTPTAPTLELRVSVRTRVGACIGCLVEITSGPGAGMRAVTNEAELALFRIPEPGSVSLRVSKDGYQTTTVIVSIDGVQRSIFQSVTIESLTPRIDLSGRYVLDVIADQSCSQLPAELRVRTYPVSVIDESHYFRVSPTTDTFKQFWMGAWVSGNDVALVIENPDNEGDGIVEPLGSGNAVHVHLWTAAAFRVADANAISTTATGQISYNCDRENPCTAVVCDSKNHHLTLTRRRP